MRGRTVPAEIRCYMRDPDGYIIERGDPQGSSAPMSLALAGKRPAVEYHVPRAHRLARP